MAEVAVREQNDDDGSAILSLHREAFGSAHGRMIAELVADLSSGPAAAGRVSLLAVTSAGIVGHALFSRGLLDAPARLVPVHVLSPIAVAAASRRRGIARELLGRGLEMLDQRGVPTVFVEGDPAFYERLGFVPAGPLGLRRPSLRIPAAAFQVHTLSAFGPEMTGTFVYPDVFWRHDAVGLRAPRS